MKLDCRINLHQPQLKLILALNLVTFLPTSLHAIEFSKDEISGSFDTTVSLGALYRVQDPSPSLIDRFNGGSGINVLNGDDGNRNFDKGMVSTALKVTHDLEINYKNFGGFFRGTYFYDFVLADKDELSETAKNKVAHDGDILDAYVFGDFEAGDHIFEVRAGSQVVNWGESTFIPNGINVINPVDVNRFRVPGAEVREALIPTPMLWASTELTPDVSLEGFYLFGFRHVEIDPRGTYFSTNDGISRGSDSIVAGFGEADENGNIPDFNFLPGPTPVPSGSFLIPRSDDKDAANSGEFGIAIRWFVPLLNQTEFGFYYLNYHSRLPLVSFVAGTNGAFPNTANYFVEYPEDINLFGISFNTISNATGIALQGEVSHRDNVPLQIEFAEVAMAATHTLETTTGGPASQLGSFNDGETIQGYKRLGLTQAQLSATKAFGRLNPFWAEEWSVVTEVGVTKVHDMPDESELRFEAPGTNMPARNDIVVPPAHLISSQDGGYAEDFAWGYRVLTQVTYTNVIGALNLFPRLVFSHDVSGTAPSPGGNYVESRKAVTAGLGISYLEKFFFDASFTKFFHAEGHNELADRDFIAMNFKYGF